LVRLNGKAFHQLELKMQLDNEPPIRKPYAQERQKGEAAEEGN
jgi:hypothetical protein